jgi:hypothetical protein
MMSPDSRFKPVYQCAYALVATGLLLGLSQSAPARIKLVALPDRASITLSVEHPDANLVQEERVLTLQKGVNQIDFNWQGVSIDASAILLEPLEHPGEVRLISIKYPPGENALVWDVFAPRAMTERVRVTYFLNGIGREVNYRAVSDTRETRLGFKQYLRLRNGSGEDLRGVRVLTGFAPAYTTDLEPNEMRQTLVGTADVPFTRTFTWDAALKPHDPSQAGATVGIPITYVIPNDAEHNLGRASLLYGKVRIFQDDGRGGTAFLGEDWGAHTPVTREMKPSIGESRDMSVTRRVVKDERTMERRNHDNRVVLYNRREEIKFTVENFRDKVATITILDHFDLTWDVVSASVPWEREDYRTLKMDVPVPASDSVVVTLVVERRNLSDIRRLQ